ncbi:GIY-YIG nuclease family protein [Haloferax namakaokahaiae]|uniref:GIY-YIG nuclease family protein n=1 Tax=Haloferax namakaokahaiae TaxID=1748331 RepID=A0ABD5ZIP4_9EURY
MHFVYMVECSDGSLYTGYTTDVERRVSEHNDGSGAKYTRGRTPVELVHVETFESKSAAMSREYEIKQLSTRKKRRLAES